MAQPRVRWFGLEDATIAMHNEEHMVLDTKNSDAFPVGTVLYGLPRHICPTVALYHEVWCVENRLAQSKWPVVARARTLTIRFSSVRELCGIGIQPCGALSGSGCFAVTLT